MPIDQMILTLAQDLFTEPADLALAHKLALVLRQVASDHADWRCNVLATSTNHDLDNGLLLDSVVSRDDNGIAGQILERDRSSPG